MFLSVDQVCWSDKYFNVYTTVVVCGLFYNFEGELDEEQLDPIINTILERLETWEKDGAKLEMDKGVSSILYKNEHELNIILN